MNPGAADRAGATSRRCVVLVADDNRDAADSLALLLTVSGHRPVVAYDGLDALERAREAAPRLVILDLDMPGLDGFEVARRLRRLGGRRVVIAALSGRYTPGLQAQAFDAGFDRCFAKPLHLEELDALLGLALAGTP